MSQPKQNKLMPSPFEGVPALVSPMTVEAKIPPRFYWDRLAEEFNHKSEYETDNEMSNQLLEHYAWLMRVTSWSFGIDWDVKNNSLTIQVPFSGMLTNIDTRYDVKTSSRADDLSSHTVRVYHDVISDIMMDVIAHVPHKRVMSHFINVVR